MPHQHLHTKSMPGKRQMGEKQHEGRNWSFGYGGHGGYGNQNPRLNPRGGASPADGDSQGDNGGQGGGNNGGDTGATANPAPTAANSPGTTQRQTNNPTQTAAQGQPTNTQGGNGGAMTLPTLLPNEGPPVHTGLHTSILDSPASVTIVFEDPNRTGQTTFATQYNGGGDTLVIDTQALTFSSGPQATSGVAGSSNLGSGSNNQSGGSNGAANTQASNGGLGGGAIAGIIVGVVLLLVISIVILFFRKRRNSRRDNSPYGKHNQEDTRSSLLDTRLAASAGTGAAAVGARSGHGSTDSTSTRNTPPQFQQGQQPLMHQRHNSERLLPTGSSHTAPRPAPPPPPPPQSRGTTHSANPSRSRLSVSIISGPPPPTHISSAFTPPTAVSPVSPVSPAVLGPPTPPSPDDGGRDGGLGGRRSSIGSVSTLSIHSAMMTASKLNWPMPPSVASTSSPSVPLTATPSAGSMAPPVPSPHYVDFEEQGRTVVRINRESLGGGGIRSAR